MIPKQFSLPRTAAAGRATATVAMPAASATAATEDPDDDSQHRRQSNQRIQSAVPPKQGAGKFDESDLLGEQTQPLLREFVPIHDLWADFDFIGIEACFQRTKGSEATAADFGDRLARGLSHGKFELFLGHKTAPKNKTTGRPQATSLRATGS
jgi:hypothetical protein